MISRSAYGGPVRIDREMRAHCEEVRRNPVGVKERHLLQQLDRPTLQGQGLGFRVKGLGLRAHEGLGFRVESLKCRA